MIDVKAHFSLNRILLLLLGLWPHHQTAFTTFHSMLFSSILTSYIGFLFTGLLTVGYKPKLIIQALTNILFFTLCAIKYNSFWINIQAMKFMIENLQFICTELSDKHEIAIMEQYVNTGRRFTAIIICPGFILLFGFLCMPIWPHINPFYPYINISQADISSYFVTEYFVDEKKSFYLAFVHMDVAVSICVLAIAGIGSYFVVYMEHGCGMFKIACYRIDQAMMMNVTQKSSVENIMLLYKKLILAIEMHHKAMKFCKFLVYTLDKPYFVLTIILVGCLSLEYYQAVMSKQDMQETLIHLTDGVTLLLYIFIWNYMGQKVTDHERFVYLSAYSIQLYRAPLSIQRMMLFVLQRGSRKFQLTISGIFSLSMEFCASLMSASLTYFTFMYSTQK